MEEDYYLDREDGRRPGEDGRRPCDDERDEDVRQTRGLEGQGTRGLEGQGTRGLDDRERAIDERGTRAIDERGHGECCDECQRSCKRQFWTELLKTVAKVAGVVLAAFGLQSFSAED